MSIQDHILAKLKIILFYKIAISILNPNAKKMITKLIFSLNIEKKEEEKVNITSNFNKL